MDRIHIHFQNLPAQEQVALKLLRHGISIKDGKAYCGNIEQADTSIARAIGVDRRVVRSTINRIMDVPDLLRLFSKLNTMLLLSDAASEIGCTTIEVVPVDARTPGVMARIMNVISSAGINIRQAVVSDPQNLTDSHLIIVVDGKIPGDVLTRVRECSGVKEVSLK